MSKKLLWIATSIFAFLSFSDSARAQVDVDLFQLPDSVCAGSYLSPTHIINGAQNYSWSFCPPDLFSAPDGVNTGAMPTLDDPVGIALVEQSGVSFTYHFNQNGDLLRSRYLQGLEGQPSLVTIVGHVDNPKGLYAVKGDDSHYHIFTISGTNASNSKLVRFDFANGVQTMPSDTVDLGIMPSLNVPKQLFIAKDDADWYGFTFDQHDSLIRLAFGSDLLSVPTVTVLGNIDNNFSNVSGLAGITELGNWHLFVTNKGNNTVDRISFGTSLDNIPFVINLGNFNNRIKRPVGITITKGCEAYYGYVLNYGTNSLVTLKWDAQSIANQPISVNQGNVAGFDQPYYLSNIKDENGTLFMFALDAGNEISKIMFRPCTNSTIPHSDRRIPPPFAYNEPGIYSIYLTINQGLPSVQTVCRQVKIIEHPPITVSNDTMICEGNAARLNALSFGADSIIWDPDFDIDTLRGHFVTVHPDYTTDYHVTTYFSPRCIVPDTITVTVSKIKADAGPDRVIKDGATTILGGAETTVGTGYSFLWTPDIGITQSTGTAITEARPPYDLTYYLHVSNGDGCQAIDSVNVRVPCDDIHLPNAFTPGSVNSLTNKFRLLNQQFVKINYFKIFDRWGKEVFTTTDLNGAWDGMVDGKEAPAGVYVWEVDANCANTGERYRKTGTVTLIR
ncbi:MAG TPA: gliding motility-associated C-terminal domain-containing protein [Edaphocola sp.]|nr:gliding motility-associated C-terminal domain-containing protein [Edaphocola sp.]